MQPALDQHRGYDHVGEGANAAEPVDHLAHAQVIRKHAGLPEQRTARHKGARQPALKLGRLLDKQRGALGGRQLLVRKRPNSTDGVSDVRRIGQRRNLRVELSRQPAVIGIEKCDELGGTAREPDIACAGSTDIARQRDELDGHPQRRGERAGPVARAIVDHDDPAHQWTLRQNTFQRLSEKRFRVERRNDDVDLRHASSPVARRRLSDACRICAIALPCACVPRIVPVRLQS